MPKADEIDIVTRLRLCASGNYYSDHDPPRNQHLLNEAAALIENMHDCLDYERGVKEALAKDYARLRSLSPGEGWKLVRAEVPSGADCSPNSPHCSRLIYERTTEENPPQ